MIIDPNKSDVMKHNKTKIDGTEITLKKVDQKTMVSHLTAFTRRKKILNTNSEKYFEKKPHKKLKALRQPQYVNKDFVCAKIEHLPIGTTKLELARFFDGLLIFKKSGKHVK